MSRKIQLSTYEQMILDIGSMTAAELESILKCAKVRLAQMKPKATRKKKTTIAEAVADASNPGQRTLTTNKLP